MSNAILVPGRPDKDQHYDSSLPSNSQGYWFAWLQRQLILKDIQAVSIEPPFRFDHVTMNGRKSLSDST